MRIGFKFIRILIAASLVLLASSAQAAIVWEIDKAHGSGNGSNSTALLTFDFAVNGADGIDIGILIENTTTVEVGSVLTGLAFMLPAPAEQITLSIISDSLNYFDTIFTGVELPGFSTTFDACTGGGNSQTCQGLGNGGANGGVQPGALVGATDSVSNLLLLATLNDTESIALYGGNAAAFETAFELAVTSANPGICARFKGIKTGPGSEESSPGAGDGDGSDVVCGGITPIPLPPALTLFLGALVGLGGLGFMKRRDKAA